MVPSQQERIGLVIIGNSALEAELLAGALARQPLFHVIGCGTTVSDLLRFIESDGIHVALIHASLHDGPLAGFAAVRELRGQYPEINLVLLLHDPEPHLIIDAFRAGAKGVFCVSRCEFKLLCKCITQVHAGQVWANSNDLRHVMEAFSQLAPLRIFNASGMKLLSKREEDVVRLVVDGLTNRDMARELKLSEHTIKNICSRSLISSAFQPSGSSAVRGQQCGARACERAWNGQASLH